MPDDTFRQLIGDDADTTKQALAKILCELKTLQPPDVEHKQFGKLPISTTEMPYRGHGIVLAKSENEDEGSQASSLSTNTLVHAYSHF